MTAEERRAYMRQYYANNKQKFRRTPEQQAAYNARRREQYQTDPEFRNARKRDAKSYRERNPLRRKLTQYGLDADALELLTDAGCAICRCDLDAEHVRVHIDHDHRTGKTRGVLCQSCNLALGHLHDDPIIAASALNYLLRGGDRALLT